MLAVSEAPVPRAVECYLAGVAPERARCEIVTEACLGLDAPTLILTDPWAEVFASWTGNPPSWPDPEELSVWLDYVATQCPECSPAEPRWLEERG